MSEIRYQCSGAWGVVFIMAKSAKSARMIYGRWALRNGDAQIQNRHAVRRAARGVYVKKCR